MIHEGNFERELKAKAQASRRRSIRRFGVIDEDGQRLLSSSQVCQKHLGPEVRWPMSEPRLG